MGERERKEERMAGRKDGRKERIKLERNQEEKKKKEIKNRKAK